MSNTTATPNPIAISSTLTDGTIMIVAENQAKNSIEMKRFWPGDEKVRTYLSLESIDGIELAIELLTRFKTEFRKRQPLAPGDVLRRIDLEQTSTIKT